MSKPIDPDRVEAVARALFKHDCPDLLWGDAVQSAWLETAERWIAALDADRAWLASKEEGR